MDEGTLDVRDVYGGAIDCVRRRGCGAASAYRLTSGISSSLPLGPLEEGDWSFQLARDSGYALKLILPSELPGRWSGQNEEDGRGRCEDEVTHTPEQKQSVVATATPTRSMTPARSSARSRLSMKPVPGRPSGCDRLAAGRPWNRRVRQGWASSSRHPGTRPLLQPRGTTLR